MPTIIGYPQVIEQMRSQGLRCLYHNSGAFGFAPDATPPPSTVAWLTQPDPTVRPAALSLTRLLPPDILAPPQDALARLAARAWCEQLPGPAWVMPMSHWAFELVHGNADWMPALLASIDVPPGQLEGRNNGAAVEFSPAELPAFERLIAALLAELRGSDFMLAFPGWPALCMLHHHLQLWWTTTDPRLLSALEALAAAGLPLGNDEPRAT